MRALWLQRLGEAGYEQQGTLTGVEMEEVQGYSYTDRWEHSANCLFLVVPENWTILTSESSSGSVKAQMPQVFQEPRLKMYRI